MFSNTSRWTVLPRPSSKQSPMQGQKFSEFFTQSITSCRALRTAQSHTRSRGNFPKFSSNLELLNSQRLDKKNFILERHENAINLYNLPKRKIDLKAELKTVKRCLSDFNCFNGCKDSIKQYFEKLSDSNESEFSQITLAIENDDFKELLSELTGFVGRAQKQFIKPNLREFLQDSINILLRQVGRFMQNKQSKECAYVYIWSVVNLLWTAEQLLQNEKEYIKYSKEGALRNQISMIEKKYADLCDSKIQEVTQKFENANNILRQQCQELQVKLKIAEKEVLEKETEIEKKMSAVSTTPIMEGLEQIYGNVQEAMNKTYDIKLEQFRCLNDYVKITKNIAIKYSDSRKEQSVQTEMSISQLTSCLKIKSNCLADECIYSLGSSLMKYLNNNLHSLPEKDTRSWDEIYKDSENILSLSCNSGCRTGKEIFNIHDATLHYFLKFLKEPKVTDTLFAYLTTITQNESRVLYAEYLARLFGLNSHRMMSNIEISIFMKKRQKMINKFWVIQNPPTSNSQIPYSEAITFIYNAFSKQMPSTGSLVFSYLHYGNMRNMTELFRYNYMESSSVAILYFRQHLMQEQDPEATELKILQHVYLMHTLNFMMKELRVQMRVAFEKEDINECGLVNEQSFKVFLRKISPIGLTIEDEELVIKSFFTKGMFDYRTFFEILNAVDAVKSSDSQISYISLCYAILRAIQATQDSLGRNIGEEIQCRLESESYNGDYMETVLLFQGLPKELSLDNDEIAYIFHQLKAYHSDSTITALLDEFFNFIKYRGELSIQNAAFTWELQFHSKDPSVHHSRKSGLSEYSRLEKRGGVTSPSSGQQPRKVRTGTFNAESLFKAPPKKDN